MAADTMVTRKIGKIFQGGFPKKRDAIKIGDSGMYPGYIFTMRATNTTAYLFNSADYTNSGYAPVGVLDDKPGQALDTAYTITTDFVEYFAIGDNVDVAIYAIPATPAPSYNVGDIIVASTIDGFGLKWLQWSGTEYTSEITASPLLKIGKCIEYRAGSTTDAKIIKVNLSS